MNIIFITREPYPLGMAGSNYVRLFAEYLAKHNCEVNVIINNRHNGDNTHQGKHNEVNYQLIKLNFLQILKGFRIVTPILKTLKSTKQKNVIVLYNGLSITNLLITLIARNNNYKVVADIVEDFSEQNEYISIRKKILLKIDIFIEKFSKCILDGVVVISTLLMKKYKLQNFKNNRITLIPVSAGNLSFRKLKKGNNKNFIFKYCGSFGKRDGIDILLNAFKYINKKYDYVELILAGKMNKYSKSYLDIIEKEDNIKFIGHVPDDDYYSFLSDSNALLMTRIDSSYANAGFPFKLGEYLGTGMPVISTDISDIKKYLSDKIDIILVSPSDEKSLIKGMEYVLDNTKIAQEIGKCGYKKAVKYFNPDINGQILYQFLESI